MIVRTFGELSLTAGLVLMLFVAYTLWGTGQYTQQQQNRLKQDFLHRTAGAPVRLGDGMALIRIPRFGKKYGFVVVEGVGTADLRKGPGHYPGTALPGRVGNFVVSGHRTTYAAPFNRLDELRPGDTILIDTATRHLVYRVTGRAVVSPSETSVVAPVPFHPGRRPTKRLITLTTCHPKYSAAQRLIVFGVLASRSPVTAEQQ
jgi:sortase A